MGQSQSITENLMPNAVDTVHMEIVKHAKVFQEIRSLSYEDFENCLLELNDLSKKCLDPNGKQLVFFVKKGTDTSLLWKATVKIACVKVDPVTRQIDNYKYLNLKQFLCVFKTFQTHLQTLVSTEEQQQIQQNLTSEGSSQITASTIFNDLHLPGFNISPSNSNCSSPEQLSWNECSICLDRKLEIILPCTHTFCTPCIEQWNFTNKTCPICCQELSTTDDIWVMSDKPGVDEISDKICAEFVNLSKDGTSIGNQKNPP